LAAIERLIGKGADVNAKDRNGATPVGWANRKSEGKAIALLQRFGGSV
jgi:hypothetical protein